EQHQVRPLASQCLACARFGSSLDQSYCRDLRAARCVSRPSPPTDGVLSRFARARTTVASSAPQNNTKELAMKAASRSAVLSCLCVLAACGAEDSAPSEPPPVEETVFG